MRGQESGQVSDRCSIGAEKIYNTSRALIGESVTTQTERADSSKKQSR